MCDNASCNEVERGETAAAAAQVLSSCIFLLSRARTRARAVMLVAVATSSSLYFSSDIESVVLWVARAFVRSVFAGTRAEALVKARATMMDCILEIFKLRRPIVTTD